MGRKTEIGWTESTWSPMRGCTRISPACKFCYAETISGRFSGIDKNGKDLAFHGFAKMTPAGGRWTNKVALIEEKLNEPCHWKAPRMIFVNSMSDLFHEALPTEDIFKVYKVMKRCPQHTFQVLTKRPGRRKRIIKSWEGGLARLPNVWEGTSVGCRSDIGFIEELRDTPAAVRFLSLEPLIEDLGELDLSGMAWAIIGGESGRGARPMKEEWARSLIEQCRHQGVKIFFKQAGDVLAKEWGTPDKSGRKMENWPKEFRIQELPNGATL